jgi:hypothetical protein
VADIFTVNVLSRHDLNGGSGLLVPPPGLTWLLQALDVSFLGTVGGFVALLGAADQVIWSNNFSPNPQQQYASWRGRAVIGPGQSCQVNTDQAMDVTLTAYQLTPP